MWHALLARLRPMGLSRRGERCAGAHLKRAGYRILARNLRNRFGEIDLLAEAPDGRTVVIVEVKSGTGGALPPEVHVNHAKQRKLTALAAQMTRQYCLTDRPLRFDIVAVEFVAGTPPQVRHHVGAFQAQL